MVENESSQHLTKPYPHILNFLTPGFKASYCVIARSINTIGGFFIGKNF